MFYAHFVLAKKGPLAKIWLAAHWDKKLTKAHVFETNIESSVEGILQPKVKMALRTSGHLLLGIVRIYSRKAKYLLADCNEAFIKIKMAFRPGVVDLPEENRAAAVAAITLPEVFHDFEAAMQNITIDMDAQVTLNQSRVEDITMKEDYGTFSLMTDEGFEMGFDEADAGRDATNIEDGFDHTSFLLAEVRAKDMSIDVEQSVPNSDKPSTSLDAPLKDDGFGGTVGEGLLDSETGGLFEPAGLFDDAPMDNVSLENTATLQEEKDKDLQDKPVGECNDNSDDDDDMYDMGPASMGGHSPPSSPDLCLNTGLDEPEPINPASSLDFVDTPQVPPEASGSNIDELNLSNTQMQPPPVSSSGLDETTLINNEDETFALAPLDFNISQNLERAGKVKRKRKLIVDEIKNISGEEMKSQLSDTADIVSSLDLAPPTKRLMHWKETGGVEKMFSLPGQTILSQSLSKMYLRNLTTRSVDNEDFGVEDDRIDLDADIEKARDDEPMMARKRRREMDSLLAQDISHMDTMHLESSRHSYTPDHRISHPSLDVSNFLQNQHQMFSPISTPQMPSQQQLMPNIMPSIMQHPPPAHMIHPMLQNDINQLSHISQMMHPLTESNPHHPMASNMHNIQSPIVSESYNQAIHHSVIESVPQHLISDGISQLSDQMQHHPMQKQMLNHPSLQNQVNHQDTNHQFQKQVSQTGMNHMSCLEDNLLQPSIDNQSLQNAIVDDEMTQPLLADQYMQPEIDRNSNAISVANSELPICDVPQPLTFNNQLASLQENQIQQVIPEIPNSIEKTEEPQPDLNDFIPPTTSEESPKESMFNNGEINQNKNNEVPVSDDDDDYGAPSSVGPALPEEQLADETYEQFEERILTKRTTHMLHTIENTLDTHHSVSFTELVRNNKRKQVAQKFYTFLVLKKQQAVELEQNSTYGDMIITKGPKFDALLNAN